MKNRAKEMTLRDFKYIWFFGLIATGLTIVIPVMLVAAKGTAEPSVDPWDYLPEYPTHTNHAALMTQEFETGSDVTVTCLGCHQDAAHEVMQTAHWNWRGEPVLVEGRDEPVSIGKANTLNNYCIGIQSNWASCTACHAGYGWEDADFDFSNPELVDCLVCHDQSGQYLKGKAGLPREGVDLLAAAQSVGLPTRENCGTCHFNGGGGNGVKHGDLDESMYFPAENQDVHMGRYNFQCIDCHRSADHVVAGRSISVSLTTDNLIYCTDCHREPPHSDTRINSHLDSVACQTCHIPAGSTREPTKMYWDWSTAGQDIPEDTHTYLKIKGSFVYESNFMPEYVWHNGIVDRYLLGDLINPSQPTPINLPQGSITDPHSLITPFKIHRAMQPYDVLYNYLIQPMTAGEGGYWDTFDWQTAGAAGMAAAGLPFSGELGFAPTEMYWNLSHMVVPAEYALQCTDCHSQDGRMDWEALGYAGDPLNWGGRGE